MDKCSRCGGMHYDLSCIYYRNKNQANSNIDLQTSKSHS